MNMYLHELRSLSKNTVIWVCAMIAIAALYLSLYSSMANAQGFQSLLSGYPPQVRAMLGVSLAYITSPMGFYSMIITFVTLCGAIQAMNSGVSILSKETRGRTADFLFVKPVSRAAVINAKFLAALTMLLATDIIYYAAASLLTSVFVKTGYNGRVFLMINLTLLFIQLIFFALGALVSVFMSRLRSVLPVSLGVVFALYFIGALFVTNESDWTRFISPFKYFDNTYIIKHSGYELPYLITGAAIVVAAIAATYFIYTRKDIHAVS